MKKIIMITLLGSVLFANNVDEGVKALKSGDYDSAVANFLFAAKQGDVIAQENLGVMYNTGLGVKQNKKTAAYWFNVAARDEEGSHCHCGCQN